MRQESGNAMSETLLNASMGEVGDRVQVGTGDMRDLPYEDGG